MTTPKEKLFHDWLKSEYNKLYEFTINTGGEIKKPFTELNGFKPKSRVFNFHKLQLIFPNNNVLLGESWNYKSKGIFYPYHDAEITCSIKEINTKNIIVAFSSLVTFDDDRQNVTEKGEFILDKKSHAVNYAKIESKLETGANGIFEVIKE